MKCDSMQQRACGSSFPLPDRLSHPRDSLLGREQAVLIEGDLGQVSGRICRLDSMYMQSPLNLWRRKVSGEINDVGALSYHGYHERPT